MKRSRIVKLEAVFFAAVTAAMGILNSAVCTRPAKAFAVLFVSNTNDNGLGSLRDTINAAAPGDTVMFNLGLPTTISLNSGEISIGQNITIVGPGHDVLTLSGNNSSRVFSISPAATVAISGLSFANGLAPLGAAIVNQGTVSVTNCLFVSNSVNSGTGGGAIAGGPGSNLTVTDCRFVGNSVTGAASGGAIFTGGTCTVATSTFSGNLTQFNGGAIFAPSGGCNVVNSTFSGNSAGDGGGIFSATPATIVNCTFTGNSAVSGGALFVEENAMTVVNCTLSGNLATALGGGIGLGPGGAVANLENTIIAGSTGGDCSISQGTIGTNSHNLIQDGTCSPLLSGNPMLGPLQNNGGATLTMALLPGSPAIDAGDDAVLGSPLFLTTDQRGTGFSRLSGPHVDIGAFEFQAAPSFDTCLKDNSTGNLFQFNSTTGQYKFTRCLDNFTLSGTGSVALVNGIRTLRDDKPDRRIRAGFNTGQLTGAATLYLNVAPGVKQLFRINATNPSAVCAC